METFSEDSVTHRFFDFNKRPYDAVNPRLTYQFWPAFQSELKRKGLSTVLDLRFNPLPVEPKVSIRRIKHDEDPQNWNLSIRLLRLRCLKWCRSC